MKEQEGYTSDQKMTDEQRNDLHHQILIYAFDPDPTLARNIELKIEGLKCQKKRLESFRELLSLTPFGETLLTVVSADTEFYGAVWAKIKRFGEKATAGAPARYVAGIDWAAPETSELYVLAEDLKDASEHSLLFSERATFLAARGWRRA